MYLENGFKESSMSEQYDQIKQQLLKERQELLRDVNNS